MVNFENAVIMLRRGKKITRDNWNKDSYWQLSKEGTIHWIDGTPALINANQVLKVTDFKEWKEPKDLAFAEEINKHPDRFQYLTKDGWINVSSTDGLSSSETTKILNSKWNHNDMNGYVFYVEFLSCDLTYKEIIRRKKWVN